MKSLLIGAVLLLFSNTARVQQSTQTGGSLRPEEVVQRQLEAYSRHDLEAFFATYPASVRVYDHPDQLQYTGVAQMRKVYGDVFSAAPKLRATVLKRITQGNHVIDHEHVSGLPDGTEIRAVAIYEVRNGKIETVWFIR